MPLLLISIAAVGLAAFFGALAWRLARQERRRSEARVAALSDAIDDDTMAMPAEHVAVQPEFLAHERPAAARHGLIKVALGFAGAVVAIIAIASFGTSRLQPAGAAAAPAPDAALELLSMRHERGGGTLTVTGLVRNGGAGAASGLTAVVFAFDRGGSFLASGRAPLEFLTLGPGDESPFRVSVPVTGDVGRYRVSFRTEAGVVRHVDRRQALLARRGE